MTVVNEDSSQDFIGNGVDADFTFTIQSLDPVWMFGRIEGLLVGGSAQLNPDQEANPGGIFTFNVIPPLDTEVRVFRNVALTQLVNFPPFGAFPARNNEDGLDKAIMALAQMFNRFENVVIEGDVEFEGGITLPNQRAITFANVDDSIDPNDLGIYRIVNILTDQWLFQTSDGTGGFVSLFLATGTGIEFPNGAFTDVTPTVPDELTNKAFVDAADIFLQNQINDLDSDIGGIAGRVTQNEEDIAQNVLDIADNAGDIATNVGDIATNVGDIATNVGNIATNVGNISANTAGIFINGLNITANASSIDVNFNNINTNTNDIAENAISIAQNVSDISDNTGNITTNTANIATNVLDIDTNATNIGINATDISDNSDAIDDRIERAGDDMTGDLTLFQITPPTGLSAVTRQFVQNIFEAIVGGLEFLGAFDASPNLNPADGTATGQFYIISEGGTLILSNDAQTPVSTPVDVGDRIIWNDTQQWWAYFRNIAGNALATAFDPSGLNYTHTNVQEAMAEADTRMFVHADNAVDETIDGIKSFTDDMIIRNNIGLHFMDVGNEDLDEDGNARIVMGSGGSWNFQKRITGGWITIMSANVATPNTITFSAPPLSLAPATVNNQLMRFQETVRTSGAQNIAGEKTFTAQLQTITGLLATPAIRPSSDDTVGIDFANDSVRFKVDSQLAAIVDPTGAALAGLTSIVTQQKGDNRYGTLAGGNTWAALQTFSTIRVTEGSNVAPPITSVQNPTTGMGFATNNPRFSINGVLAAKVDPAGAAMTEQASIVTQQKGDARYTQQAQVDQSIDDHNTDPGRHTAQFDDKLDTGLAVLLAGNQLSIGGEKTWNATQTYSGSLNQNGPLHNANNIPTVFRNAANSLMDLGAHRFINSGANSLLFQRNTGTGWQTWLTIPEDIAGVESTITLGAGTAPLTLAGSSVTVITTINFNLPTNLGNDQSHNFRNSNGDVGQLGAKRILNDASNNLRIQHHNGAAFQDGITLRSTGVVDFAGPNGLVGAIVENPGNAMAENLGIVTRQKGDFRYARWHTTEADAAAQTDDLIHFADEGS